LENFAGRVNEIKEFANPVAAPFLLGCGWLHPGWDHPVGQLASCFHLVSDVR
jgi:hypothetical protein